MLFTVLTDGLSEIDRLGGRLLPVDLRVDRRRHCLGVGQHVDGDRGGTPVIDHGGALLTTAGTRQVQVAGTQRTERI